MSFSPLLLAELKLRVAELEHKAAASDFTYPGESAFTQSRRYRERKRKQDLAKDYRRLIELAEATQ